MFSFGWSELALTAVIIVIVVGPKEIPNLLRQLGSFTKTIKKISREFKSSLNEIADHKELKDVKNSLTDIKEIKKNLDPTNEIKDQIGSIKKNLDPTNEIKDQIGSIKKAANIYEKEINDLNNLDNKQPK